MILKIIFVNKHGGLVPLVVVIPVNSLRTIHWFESFQSIGKQKWSIDPILIKIANSKNVHVICS